MGLVAGAPFHWGGVVYNTGDPVVTTGWSEQAIRRLISYAPVYEAGGAGSTGPAGPAGPAGPTGMTWRGSWASGTAYVADDGVLGSDGSAYIALSPTTGVDPTTDGSVHWQVVAQHGAAGAQGAQGAQGAAGAAGVAGHSVLSGSGSPFDTTGSDGDYYVDTTNHLFYGPKASGSWGSRTATPVFRASSAATGSGNPSPATLTIPAAVQPGDVMICATVAQSDSGTPNVPTGWTLIASSVTTTVFWKTAVAGDAGSTLSIAYTPTGGGVVAALVAYSGADPTNPIGQSSGVQSGLTTTSITPTFADKIIEIFTGTSFGDFGAPASTTQRAMKDQYGCVMIADETGSAGVATTARTATGGAGTIRNLAFGLVPALAASNFSMVGPTGATGATGATGSAGTAGVGMAEFSHEGVLTVSTGDERWYNDTGRTLTIGTVRASVGVAPTGTATVDVKKNGTSIFGGARTLATGVNTNTYTPTTTTIANGEYFTVDRPAADGVAADLVVQIPLS